MAISAFLPASLSQSSLGTEGGITGYLESGAAAKVYLYRHDLRCHRRAREASIGFYRLILRFVMSSSHSSDLRMTKTTPPSDTTTPITFDEWAKSCNLSDLRPRLSPPTEQISYQVGLSDSSKSSYAECLICVAGYGFTLRLECQTSPLSSWRTSP